MIITKFKTLGTMCFDPHIMKAYIFFGKLVHSKHSKQIIRDYSDKRTICLTEWFMLVPEIFEEPTKKAIEDISEQFRFEVATDKVLDRFIDEFQRLIKNEISEKRLTNEGWEYLGISKLPKDFRLRTNKSSHS